MGRPIKLYLGAAWIYTRQNALQSYCDRIKIPHHFWSSWL